MLRKISAIGFLFTGPRLTGVDITPCWLTPKSSLFQEVAFLWNFYTLFPAWIKSLNCIPDKMTWSTIWIPRDYQRRESPSQILLSTASQSPLLKLVNHTSCRLREGIKSDHWLHWVVPIFCNTLHGDMAANILSACCSKFFFARKIQSVKRVIWGHVCRSVITESLQAMIVIDDMVMVSSKRRTWGKCSWCIICQSIGFPQSSHHIKDGDELLFGVIDEDYGWLSH